jgi:hypothetical protein
VIEPESRSVIVNHSHKFIFVHVPKAAGTSVSELFSKFSAYSDLEVGGTELGEALQNAYKRRFGLTKHSTADEIHAVVGDETWREYYSFAFVRDPYARAQSTFHFMKRWHGNKEMKQLAFMDDHADFRSFVMSDTFVNQKAHRLLWPQARWLVDSKGALAVDYVGRLESLDQDIHHVLSSAPGLVAAGAAPSSAPARNKSASTDAALYELLSSDPEVEERIYEAYKVDFERFDYPRFDIETTPRPTAERTPDVAPIVARSDKGGDKPGKFDKGHKAGGAGDKPHRVEAGAANGAAAAGERADKSALKQAKMAKLNKMKGEGKTLSPAKLEKLNKMMNADKAIAK